MEEFDYGVVETINRLDINKGINFKKYTIDKCIRFALVKKCDIRDNSYWEIQILYIDENNDSQLAKYNLDDKEIRIKHQGDMLIEL